MKKRRQSRARSYLASLGTVPVFSVYVFLLVWLAAVTLPLLWVLINSFRGAREFAENPFGLPWVLTGSPYPDVDPWAVALGNFRTAWIESQFGTFFVNSVIVTCASLLGILAFGSMAAYVLARFSFPGRRLLYLYFISGMMFPAQLLLVPLFFQCAWLGDTLSRVVAPLGLEVHLHDSLGALTMIYIALSLPFTILVLTGFFKTLPGELREAAILDGCGEFRAFWHVMLPLARPGLAATAIFNFLGLWNEYLFALVFLNAPEKRTLPLGLAGVSMQAQYQSDFGLMFAGLVIVLLPTLGIYLLLQRQLTRGITLGALKG